MPSPDQLNLDDFLDDWNPNEDVASIESALYISEYNNLDKEGQELKVAFEIDIQADGQIQVKVAQNQEGGGKYIPGYQRGELGQFDNLREAREAMENFFYEFFGTKAIEDTSNDIQGPIDFKSVTQQQTRDTQGSFTQVLEDEDEIESQQQSREKQLKEFKKEIKQRISFYKEQISRKRDVIQEDEQIIEEAQERIAEKQDRLNALKSWVTRYKNKGQMDKMREQQGQVGQFVKNQIQPFRNDIEDAKQDIARAQQEIIDAQGRLDNLQAKQEEINDLLDDL